MDLLSPPDALSRLRLWERLPPFHPVALRLMRVISSDSIALNEIAGIIRCDPAFAAELLRLANSPLFNFRYEIGSVLQAAGLLGLERVRGLALTVALRRFLDGSVPSLAARICWRHSLACALVAEEIAAAAMTPTDAAHTAGLVHDVGRLALLAGDPALYTALLESSEPEPLMLCELERHAFGLDHCELGAAMMENWRFPESLWEVAALHHHPVCPARFGLTEIVKVACRVADALGFQVAGPAPPLDARGLAGMLPASVSARWRVNLPELSAAVATRINSLEICG